MLKLALLVFSQFSCLFFGRVITDDREWRHFKQLYKLDTPLEEGMFSLEGELLVHDL